MLYYEEYGNQEKETVILIHGLATSSWVWWQQIEALKDYHVIAIDLPGHGNSADIPWISLEDVAKQIKTQIVKDKKVHLIGVSLGGHVALDFSKYYLENTASTYISGITVRPMSGKIFMPLVSRYYVRMLKNEDNLIKMARQYNVPSNKVQEFKSTAQSLSREDVATLGLEIMRFNFDDSYSHIKAPMKIVCGDQEEKSIQDSLIAIPKIIQTASSESIPNAQHQWPIQKPEQFNQRMLAWLEDNNISTQQKRQIT